MVGKQTLLVLAGSSIAAAWPAASWASVPSFSSLFRRCDGHTCVSPMPEYVPDTPLGRALLAFKPELHISNGCHPFAAVGSDGQVNNGLKTTGAPDGSCGADLNKGGQVYARGKQFPDRWGLLYAFYMPKDQGGLPGIGHRHDWEGTVVWVDDINSATPKVIGVAPSKHGGWVHRDAKDVLFDGLRAKTEYVADWPNTHRMGFASTVGESFPLVEWDSMPAIARDLLNNHDFGEAVVPIKDATFDSNLKAAFGK